MRNTLTILLAIATTASSEVAAQSASDAPAMRPGLWEISYQIDTAGSDAKRNIIARSCYGADDFKAIERVVPVQREFGMKCENRQVTPQGATVTWKIMCTSKDSSLIGNGEMKLSVEGYEAKASLDTKVRGKAGKVSQSIVGKRIGDCK
jgi:Protein of unknown function (DUF3617)